MMASTYDKLLQNLNIVKWELKGRNDPTLNLCIKYIKDAIVEAGRLNAELEKHQFMRPKSDMDVFDCYD
jgi:hypothetical protein